MILINGDRYEGNWKDGQLNGFGKCIKANNSVYEGEYLNGEKDGNGIITWANGNKYEGGWKDGNKHGFGKDIFINGKKWEGEYFHGKKKEDIVIPKDQALEVDWKDQINERRIKDRKDRIKKILSNSSNLVTHKRRRKKPPFVIPNKQ